MKWIATHLTCLMLLGLLIECSTSGVEQKDTFYVDGPKIYAPNGEEFVARGVNKMVFFRDRTGVNSYPEIAKTGANIVRIFWFTSGTPEELDSTITHCIANKMIPMPSVWEATGKWSQLKKCVDYWSRKDIVEVIQKHKRYLLLNIANEAGNFDVSESEYRDIYRNVILRLREAGITVPLVVDASGWGRRESDIFNNGPSILQSDPLSNVIFSWHPWDANAPQSRIKSAIDGARSLGLAFIVGEFAKMEVGCKCCIEYKYIMDYCQETGTGWMAWSWGPGNGDCPDMDMTENNKFETLHDWGFEVALTDPNSIQNTSKRPDIFN